MMFENLVKNLSGILPAYAGKIETTEYLKIERCSTTKITETITNMKSGSMDYLNTEKNSEYETTYFLYKAGFLNLKRVKEFVNTMKNIGNIEEYLSVENEYSCHGMELLNSNMLSILKNNHRLSQTKHTNYDGLLPEEAIKTLKKNFKNAQEELFIFNFKKSYHNDSSGFRGDVEIDNYERVCLKDKVHLFPTKTAFHTACNYWKVEMKPLYVLHNKTSGMILVEIKKDYFLVLTQWNEIGGKTLSFNEFAHELKS